VSFLTRPAFVRVKPKKIIAPSTPSDLLAVPATNLSKDNQVLLLRSILEEPMYQIASPSPPLVLSRKDIGLFPPPAYQRSNFYFFSSCLVHIYCACSLAVILSLLPIPLLTCRTCIVSILSINERRHSGLMNETLLLFLIKTSPRVTHRTVIKSFHIINYAPEPGPLWSNEQHNLKIQKQCSRSHFKTSVPAPA
jgi:hypothetical protein